MEDDSKSNPITNDLESAILQRRIALKTSFGTQANAILRKNLIFQRRNWKSSCCLVSLPVLLCLLLLIFQILINLALSGNDYKCGCGCVQSDSSGKCIKKECSLRFSNSLQAGFCGVPHPPEWPAFQQVAKSQYRTVQRSSPNFGDLPDSSCKNSAQGCPATILYTGSTKVFADKLGVHFLKKNGLVELASQYGNVTEGIRNEVVFASSNYPGLGLFFETGIIPGKDEKDIQASNYLQYSCQNSISFNFNISVTSNFLTSSNISCLSLFSAWRNSRDAINKELYAGYWKSKTFGNRVINEYSGAYDFADSNENKFTPIVFYNDSIAGIEEPTRNLLRIPRAMNLASNAFIRAVLGSNVSIPLKFVKEYPKPNTKLSLDFSSILGPLFYMWLLLLLFPVLPSPSPSPSPFPFPPSTPLSPSSFLFPSNLSHLNSFFHYLFKTFFFAFLYQFNHI